jgi:tRNA (cytidine32/uridine32-2'-O)-methyltransferase
MSYELYVTYLAQRSVTSIVPAQPILAESRQVQLFYQRLERLLTAIHFSNIDRSHALIRRLKRLFNRARLEAVEINILQGIISALFKKLNIKE